MLPPYPSSSTPSLIRDFISPIGLVLGPLLGVRGRGGVHSQFFLPSYPSPSAQGPSGEPLLSAPCEKIFMPNNKLVFSQRARAKARVQAMKWTKDLGQEGIALIAVIVGSGGIYGHFGEVTVTPTRPTPPYPPTGANQRHCLRAHLLPVCSLPRQLGCLHVRALLTAGRPHFKCSSSRVQRPSLLPLLRIAGLRLRGA